MCVVSMSANGVARSNGRGNRASDALTAVTDGVGHRRLVVAMPTPQKLQTPIRVAPCLPPGTTLARLPSVRRPLPSDASPYIDDDDNDGSTREPPSRRQRNVPHSMLRLFEIIDLRPLEADSSLTGLSLSRCEQALHFVRLLRQLPEQASAAANDDSDASLFFSPAPSSTATTETTTRDHPSRESRSHHQQQILSRPSPSQSLPKHPNNQQRQRQRPTTMTMTSA